MDLSLLFCETALSTFTFLESITLRRIASGSLSPSGHCYVPGFPSSLQRCSMLPPGNPRLEYRGLSYKDSILMASSPVSNAHTSSLKDRICSKINGGGEINSGLTAVIKDEGATWLILIFWNRERIRMAQRSREALFKPSHTFNLLKIYQSCFQNTLWEMGIMVMTFWGCYEDWVRKCKSSV